MSAHSYVCIAKYIDIHIHIYIYRERERDREREREKESMYIYSMRGIDYALLLRKIGK